LRDQGLFRTIPVLDLLVPQDTVLKYPDYTIEKPHAFPSW
jgi:hypothetical protein